MDDTSTSVRQRRVHEDINKGMDNVIPFPKAKREGAPPQSDEEMRLQVIRNKKKYVNNIVDHYTNQLAMKFVQHGFNLEDEEFLKDFSFSVETIRSGLYRTLGIGHPFQQLMDEAIETLESVEQEHIDEYTEESEYDEDPELF